MKNLHEALGILLEYRNDGDSGSCWSVCAEHDELFIGGPHPGCLRDEHVARLSELHVHWSDDEASWYMFT